jgi:hypothetical protein
VSRIQASEVVNGLVRNRLGGVFWLVESILWWSNKSTCVCGS